MAMFIWPTTTRRITSQFRPPHRSSHHGLDIAEGGTHEVFAVADGTVSRSYRSDSYGEVVFIVHNMNGQTWESVYAHMRSGSRRVKVGDKVKQGQVIGIMGSTGHSTGQHLHFELHKGRWNINKTNAVDPLDYLDKGTTSTTTKSNIIRKGNRGKDVAILQRKLMAVGEKLTRYGDDGRFGDETERAVKAFQERKSIKVDGIVGPETEAELNKALPNYSRLLRNQSPMLKGNDVRAVQRVVGVKDDRVYGPNTASAVKSYQRKHSLKVDGIVGTETWRHMFG